MDKRLFVFVQHGETSSFFAEKTMNCVQMKMYTAENI